MMRGEDAGLEDNFVEGWLRRIVCVAFGGPDTIIGEMGWCLREEAFVEGI